MNKPNTETGERNAARGNPWGVEGGVGEQDRPDRTITLTRVGHAWFAKFPGEGQPIETAFTARASEGAAQAEIARRNPGYNVVVSPPDVRVEDHGSILFLRPQTDAGIYWVNVNIGEDSGYQPDWPSVLVEPRFVGDIIQGMRADGLEVR